MKLYRVTVYDFGTFGPRGMTIAGTGLNVWANTDKAKALRYYKDELKAAAENNRQASLKLQIITTPKQMTTESWIEAIINGEVPYEVTRTLEEDFTNPVDLSLKAAS